MLIYSNYSSKVTFLWVLKVLEGTRIPAFSAARNMGSIRKSGDVNFSLFNGIIMLIWHIFIDGFSLLRLYSVSVREEEHVTRRRELLFQVVSAAFISPAFSPVALAADTGRNFCVYPDAMSLHFRWFPLRLICCFAFSNRKMRCLCICAS